MRGRWVVLALAGLVLGGSMQAVQAAEGTGVAGPASSRVMTPVQTTWLRAEINRANDLFVRRVVAITNMPHDSVRRAIPAEGRITEPSARIVAALEKDSGKSLNEDQRTAIRAAEEDRRDMIATARVRVWSR